MKNIKIETTCGDSFANVAEEAQQLSIKSINRNVEFDFNGVLCIVSATTNLDYLFRDYCNAHTMDWKTVGSDCVTEYSDKIKNELAKREVASKKKHELQRKEWEKEEQSKKRILMSKIKDIKFECPNPKEFKDWADKNTDAYGGRVFTYAVEWAKLMQSGIAKGKKIKDIADKTSREADYDGITGFMYGAAVNVLAKCWKHGEELRKWHNKEYDHEGDGVVNPAVLKVSI